MQSLCSTAPALVLQRKVSQDRGRKFVWVPRCGAQEFFAMYFADPCERV